MVAALKLTWKYIELSPIGVCLYYRSHTTNSQSHWFVYKMSLGLKKAEFSYRTHKVTKDTFDS